MRKKSLTLLLCAVISVSSLMTIGCEKSDYYDDHTENAAQEEKNGQTGGASESEDNGSDSGSDSSSDSGGSGSEGDFNPPTDSDILTVGQLLSGSYEGESVFVVGYIVGDCTRGYSKAEFEPPFTHPQALLIADTPDERDKEYLVAVELKSKPWREKLSLVEHPEYYHRRVVVLGYPSKYLGMAGLRSIGYYEIK